MKKQVVIFCVFFLVFMIIPADYFLEWHSSNSVNPVVLSVNKEYFYVEVVSSVEDLQRGLGGRDSLCGECGMLFKFNSLAKRTFWMKDMKFPLDILWINGSEIVYIVKNVSANFGGTVSPKVLADKVLEINAGISDKIGIKEGMRIEFKHSGRQ